jgi:hypothetical protein
MREGPGSPDRRIHLVEDAMPNSEVYPRPGPGATHPTVQLLLLSGQQASQSPTQRIPTSQHPPGAHCPGFPGQQVVVTEPSLSSEGQQASTSMLQQGASAQPALPQQA